MSTPIVLERGNIVRLTPLEHNAQRLPARLAVAAQILSHFSTLLIFEQTPSHQLCAYVEMTNTPSDIQR
jgi:hypothetical protein